jgi:hypothetical protein
LDEGVLLALACKKPIEHSFMVAQYLLQIPEYITDELRETRLWDDGR